MKSVIEVENLSKKYKISRKKEGLSYSTLRDDIVEAAKNSVLWISGRKEKKEEIWALKDVSFKVDEGEILGLIGLNGAGKSTLLKVLTRVTPPSEGRAIIRGRIGSLLDVGTGFHPELTGRENIYFNGAILGMRKKEIDKKFDEIVAFAEVEKFLDTPVKRYSSGMHLRLAFSVAANLDADILLVDEVLSVGDVVFQKKSFTKMQEVTKKGSRTVVFVSHNMGAVKSLCTKTILLDKGRLVKMGPTEEVINYYLDKGVRSNAISEYAYDQSKRMQIRKVTVLGHDSKPSIDLDLCKSFSMEIEYQVNEPISNVALNMFVFSNDGSWVLASGDTENNENDYYKFFMQKREPGRYVAKIKFPANLFNKGTYQFKFLMNLAGSFLDSVDNVYVSFYDSGYFYQKYNTDRDSLVTIPIPWETKRI